MKIILRKDAKALKLKRYFTGKECKHGHIDERITCSGSYVKCSNIRTQHYRKENKERYKKQKYIWDRTYRQKHDNELKAKKHEYYIGNIERLKAKSKEYSQNNKHKLSKHSIRRNYKRYQATPPWYVTEKSKINKLYTKRDELSELWGIQLHVDHIVPIQGKYVCGLHCWDNLQLLEASLNLAKRNKFKDE